MSGISTLARLVVERALLGLVTLFVVSVITFSAVQFLPGDIAEQTLGQGATPETVAAFRERLGLNQSPVASYLTWLGNIVTGDFGVSILSGDPIASLLFERFGNSVFLALYAALLATPLAIVLAIMAAALHDTAFDKLLNGIALSTVSTPEFFVAYIVILVLAVQVPVFPPISTLAAGAGIAEMLWRAFLPALVLALGVGAYIMRMTRAAIVDVANRPFIEMAELKGLSKIRIILRHILPNAAAPIINIVALNLAYLLTGVVVVEVVFAYPGLGQILVDAVTQRDVTVVQASCLVFAATYIIVNSIADILTIILNPRLADRTGK